MNDIRISRSPSFTPLSSPQAPTRVAPTVQTPSTPAPTPISAEAQQMVRQAGKAPPTPTTVANAEDIQSIRSAVEAITEPLGTLPEAKPEVHANIEQKIGAERLPADNRSLLRKALLGGMDRGSHASEQQKRLSAHAEVNVQQATDMTQLANQIQDKRATPAALRSAIAILSDHPDAAALKTRLDEVGTDPVGLRNLRNTVVGTLRAQSRHLTATAQAEGEASKRIGKLTSEGAEELIANASLVASAVSSSNSIVKLATGSAEGFMGVAASAVGVGFGALQIVTEAAALRRNLGRLNEALTRSESAELVLAPVPKRGEMIAKMQTEIQNLSQPSMFRTKSGREAGIAKLQAKVAALQAMGSTESPPEAKAIAKQVVDSNATVYKALRVAKNVAGLAAGAIAIAVAAGALATPVGWVAAGVVLTATAGLFLYNKYKTKGKEEKMDGLMANRTDIAKQIANLQAAPASQTPGSPQQQAITKLEALQQKNMVKLLTVSPRHAADAILAGLKATPPDVQMRVLATQVLNVPEGMARGPFSAHQEAELTEYLMRGMPLQPKL